MTFPELTTGAYIIIAVCVVAICIFLITAGKKKKK